MEKINSYFTENNIAVPAVIVEPGRKIVGESGTTLYTVGSTKDIPGVRKYVSVNGGMGDNIRPALYGAKYRAVVANKADSPPEETITISGKYCESGDIIVKDINLPKVEAGDIVAVLSTGAYGYSMASNYNKNKIPGVILVKDGSAQWLVTPQDYDDVIKNEVLLTNLD